MVFLATGMSRRCFWILLSFSCLLITIFIFSFDVRLYFPKFEIDGVATNNSAMDLRSTMKSSTVIANRPKWLLKTSGCKIYDIDPFNFTIRNLIATVPPFRCPNNVTTGLVYIDQRNGLLMVNSTVRRNVIEYFAATISENGTFGCCVNYLKRFSNELSDDGYRMLLPNCVKFTDLTPVLDEFMLVQCFLGDRCIYSIHDFAVIRKMDVEARCAAVLEMEREKGFSPCQDRLSVLVVGVDSVSRLNFHRHLTETKKALAKMGAVEFLALNKIGENTFPNMAAFLSGKSVIELQRDCWGKGWQHYFDNCTFLWDSFAAVGYRTAFVENMNEWGLFTYAKKGFHRQPADYYGRTFFNGVGAETCLRRDMSEDEAVLQWALEFQEEFAFERHFGYFWISRFSHDLFNGVQRVDPLLSRYLHALQKDRLLNRTLLILASDHGIRFDKIRSTAVGRYEARLPFLFAVFPPWFRRKYPKVMNRFTTNAQRRLTTVLDLHRTLVDVAAYSYEVNPSNQADGLRPPNPSGISLFSQISPGRTCQQAGIPRKFCACVNEGAIALDTNAVESMAVASVMVDRLNRLTFAKRNLCKLLSLSAVVETKAHSVGAEVIEYDVVFETSPCNGTFEGYVTFVKRSNTYTVDEGDDNIRRINKYANTSSCITDDPRLLPVCCCS